jgi:hypothetical protein
MEDGRQTGKRLQTHGRMSVGFFEGPNPVRSRSASSLLEAQRAPDLRPAHALQRLSVVRSDPFCFAAQGALRPLFVERFLGATHSATAPLVRYLSSPVNKKRRKIEGPDNPMNLRGE